MSVRWTMTALLAAVFAISAAPCSAADAQGEANKHTLQQFLADMRTAGYAHHDPEEIRRVVERYTTSNYIQHSKKMLPGREGLVNNYAAITAKWPKKQPAPDPGDLYFIADGDQVVWVSKKPDLEGAGKAQSGLMFQMVRFEKGRIAEHWDSLE